MRKKVGNPSKTTIAEMSTSLMVNELTPSSVIAKAKVIEFTTLYIIISVKFFYVYIIKIL